MFIDLPIFKLDYEIRDSQRLEVDTPCVIVSNHQSSLDVIGILSRPFISSIDIKPVIYKITSRLQLKYKLCKKNNIKMTARTSKAAVKKAKKAKARIYPGVSLGWRGENPVCCQNLKIRLHKLRIIWSPTALSPPPP